MTENNENNETVAQGMQILVLENKPYTYLEVAEGVANAVWNFLELSEIEPLQNHANMEQWVQSGYRKIVRRVSKESQWQKVLESNINGLETVTNSGLKIYVTEPHPVNEVEKVISRTQVSGFKPEAESISILNASKNAIKIFLNEDLDMSIGKAAAAAGHIAQKAYFELPLEHKNHLRESFNKFVIAKTKNIENKTLEQVKNSYPLYVVDHGYTEVKSGSVTAVGQF